MKYFTKLTKKQLITELTFLYSKYDVVTGENRKLNEQLRLLSVVRSLPTKREIASELENHQNKWSKSHDNKTNDSYALGFRHCFHFISDWINFGR